MFQKNVTLGIVQILYFLYFIFIHVILVRLTLGIKGSLLNLLTYLLTCLLLALGKFYESIGLYLICAESESY